VIAGDLRSDDRQSESGILAMRLGCVNSVRGGDLTIDENDR